ncbi:target of rapamycin complex subunit lst8-like [Oscarella lobularis]|uniref:target of rapamycin complex subunit lst8-like n=1 Tax=Oscarella lobularis TaxID=121494 RepID=UPI0033138197
MSQNGQVLLATAGYDHTIRFWQAHSGICTKTVQHPDSQVNALAFTPDRQQIAAAGYQHIRLYDVNSSSSNPLINYDGLTKNVTCIGFDSTGKWMFTGGEDKTAKIWDLRVRNIQCQRIFQMTDPCTCTCLHPNQIEMIIGNQGGGIHLWDLRTDHNEQIITDPGVAVRSISVDPDASYLAVANNAGVCYVWSLSVRMSDADGLRLTPKAKVECHSRYVLKCLFSPDSCLLATTSADNKAKIWNTADFSLRTTLSTESQKWVWDCAFSADSQYLVTASSDGLARLWSIDHGAIKREYQGHQKAIVCLAFYDGSTDA